MSFTSEQVRETDEALQKAVHMLFEAQVPKVVVAEFQERSRRWLFPRKARFHTVADAWPLGVLLLTPAGKLFQVGETTRSVPPGYPGHTSVERERRREFTRVAYESGFPEGSTIFYRSQTLAIVEGSTFDEGQVLGFVDGQLKVRWNRSLPISTGIPFNAYVREQVELHISKHQSQ